jgi:DNA-binding transcriptional ArsR family regulator
MPKDPLSILPVPMPPSETEKQEDISLMVAELNRMIHEPARLAILTVLSACESADFTFVRTATGLTAGNLSVQITRLEEAGLVTIEKVIEKKRPLTTVSLTSKGRGELSEYWRGMEQLREQVRMPAAVRPKKRRARTGALRPQRA